MAGTGVDSILDTGPDQIDDWADEKPGMAISTMTTHERKSFNMVFGKKLGEILASKLRVECSLGDPLAS
jgi:hypothetical protein